MAAVGISFGVSNLAVAVFQSGKVEVIANDQGHRTTPACVSFTDAEVLTGEAAKGQTTINPDNTIHDMKRMLGKSVSDLENDMQRWAFKISAGNDGVPVINVTYMEEEKTFSAEEIFGFVLGRMKQTADAYVGKDVAQAVIAVPAYFSQDQRRIVENAGKRAGLEIFKVISEPVASAMAYGIDRRDANSQNVLVFDLGGGTLDVTVLNVAGGKYEVKATAGDLHLGGEDFDNRLVTYFAGEFAKKHKKDISKSARALRRLRTACELARRSLSTMAQASIEVDSLFEGIDFYSNLSRARLQELCGDLFRSCIEVIDRALKDAQMDKDQVDTIILVGGASRMHRLQELIEDMFRGKEILKSINLDEVVAYGCAVQAAMLTGEYQTEGEEGLDAVLLSLGIETFGGVVDYLIPKGTEIPVTVSRIITTAGDDQSVIRVNIFEGERPLSENSTCLGFVELTDLVAGRRGVPQIDVKFSLGKNGQLHVTLTELPDGKSTEATFPVYHSQAGEDDEIVVKKVVDADKHRAIDEAQKEDVAARNLLISLCSFVAMTLENGQVSKSVPDDERLVLQRKCGDITTWLAENTDADRDVMDDRQRDLEDCFKLALEKVALADNSAFVFLAASFQGGPKIKS